MTSWSPRLIVGLLAALVVPASASAQANPASASTPPVIASQEPDPDLQVVLGEPDFTLGALPTTLRMPAGKLLFHLTHRFSLPIAAGTAGDFFKNFFNMDSAAQIGFELRYGLRSGTQLDVLRTNERTIQFLAQQELVGQHAGGWLSADVIAAVEGRQNFSQRYATTLGGVLSHRFGDHGAVYAQPYVVINANTTPATAGEDRHTMVFGVGARVRIAKSRAYLVGEFAPRVAGFSPGVHHASVGIEKRLGGHVFQINISHTVGTTLAQVARGGLQNKDWFIGFNLTRKFW